MNYYKSLALFAGGVLFGSAGIKLLSSKDAKKVYTHTTAAALRMKDCVMGTVTTVQENAADILASAKDINQVGDGFENRIRRRQGRREETFPHNLKDDLADELFLISPVQGPSAMRRRQFGNLWCVVRKPAQKSQQGGSFSAILNHRAARPFMYRRLPNGRAVIQIGFQ